LLFVGLTGGIGSGKSEALAACGRLGAATLSTDRVVHELLSTDALRGALEDRWGADVVSDGTVDRDAVARIVFERPEELAWLEGMLFPRVGERMAAWRAELEQAGDAPEIGVVEVPLLFEAGVEAAFDATVAVVTEEQLREERASSRGHEAVAGRQGRQLSQEEKAARADYVVRNDGTLDDLEAAIAQVLAELTKKAETRGSGSG
jgi:dephospho-CoA kinase